MAFQCPGSLGVKEPKPELVKCSNCGYEVEIWTDEVKMACPRCKRKVSKALEQSCLEWCKYAKECAGEAIYNKYIKNRLATIREKLNNKGKGSHGEEKDY